MSNRICVVSGYVPIPEVINVSEARFRELGVALYNALPCGKRFYDDTERDDIFETWMFNWLEKQPWQHDVVASDPNPDPRRFEIPEGKLLSNYVMHQKYEWLALAALEDPYPATFVWIDYGVLKQENMSPKVIHDFILRLERMPIPAITAPGIKPTLQEPDPLQSWDRFCGSLVIVPRHLLFNLCRWMKRDAMQTIEETKMVTIESNTLARAEIHSGLPFHWVPSWWGASMFECIR